MNQTTNHGNSLDQMVGLINSLGGNQLPQVDDPNILKVTLENFASTHIPLWSVQTIR